MNNNTVRLKVNGQEYSYWEDITITSELNAIARSFALTVTYRTPDGRRALTTFRPSSEVQVLIGEDLVLTGYVDQLPISYDANNVTATVAGRSKTQDLVDCCQAPQDYSITTSSTSWSGNTPYIPEGFSLVSPSGSAQRSWNKEKISSVIATMIAPYGIALKVDNKVADTLNQSLKDSTFKVTDTIVEILKSIIKEHDVALYDDAYGDLLATKILEDTNASEPLILGKNILQGSAAFDASDIYRDYEFYGEKKGSDEVMGADTFAKGRATDNLISRQRFLVLKQDNQVDNAQTVKGAQGEAEYRHAKYSTVSYTVAGWRKSDGKLWQINTYAMVTDEVLGFDNLCMLITRVEFSISNTEGLITYLELVPPKGFKPGD